MRAPSLLPALLTLPKSQSEVSDGPVEMTIRHLVPTAGSSEEFGGRLVVEWEGSGWFGVHLVSRWIMQSMRKFVFGESFPWPGCMLDLCSRGLSQTSWLDSDSLET